MARRVVRRGAVDSAWDTVLADFPPELHPYMRQYVETRRAHTDAKNALENAKVSHRIRWEAIDLALGGLA